MMSVPYPQQPSSPSSCESDVPHTFRSRLVLRPFMASEEHATEGSLILPGVPNGDTRRGPLPRIEVMDPPANRLIDLIKEHYPAYEQRTPLPAHVRHAMQMIHSCHTDALGGHVERCPEGHISRVFYNSCGHRWCPRCAGRQRRTWLLARRAKLLPVRHYHVVFTVSHGFNALWRLNPRLMGDLLFHSATETLRAFLADPRWLGAEPGITITLETWDDQLFFHPHLHGLVTGGGLTPEGAWQDVPNPRCLVAVKPLMWAFRKQFCQGLKQMLHEETLTLPEGTTTRQWLNTLNRVNRQKWAVFIAKPPEDGGPTTDDILRYQAEDVAGGPLSGARLVPPLPVHRVISPLDRLMLSPRDLEDLIRAQQELSSADRSETLLAYLKSFPLSASRLEDASEGEVRFRWGAYDPATGTRERTEVETLPVDEFLHRYLQHLPPPHYQTVRHYGLYTSAKHAQYARCRDLLADREPPGLPPASDDTTDRDTDAWLAQHTCPVCGKPLLVSSYLPSSVSGRIIPRLPIGHGVVQSLSLGGGHDP